MTRESRTANAVFVRRDATGDWWEELDENGSGTDRYFQCYKDHGTGTGYPCEACGRGFTRAEWDDRHDDDEDPDAYYHAECCPACKAMDSEIWGEVSARNASRDASQNPPRSRTPSTGAQARRGERVNGLTILSLGWGVQSWTLAAMSALDELPKVTAVHADTTWESEATYQFAAEWGQWLVDRGVDVVTVKADNTAPIRDYHHATKGDYQGSAVPAFTYSKKGNGQVRRQCTADWKITPIRRYISNELARLGLAKSPGIIEQWLGISTDEWQRAKDADVKYITHRYPLLDLNMSRADCVMWLQSHGLPVPPKSSCTFCPYHNARAWQEIKRRGGHDWQEAVEIDLQIRNARPPYPLYVHPARVPLTEAVQIPEDFGMEQAALFDTKDAACDSGYCFL